MKLDCDEKNALLDFINETARYFAVNPPALNEGICAYRGEASNCAIGRHVADENYHEDMEGRSFLGLVELALDYRNDLALPEEERRYWNSSLPAEEALRAVKDIRGVLGVPITPTMAFVLSMVQNAHDKAATRYRSDANIHGTEEALDVFRQNLNLTLDLVRAAIHNLGNVEKLEGTI